MPHLSTITYTIYVTIFVIGLCGAATSANMMKKLISLSISQTGLILLYIMFGYHSGGVVPLYKGEINNFVDPLPQVLMLTAIVVGLSVSAIGISIISKLEQVNRTDLHTKKDNTK